MKKYALRSESIEQWKNPAHQLRFVERAVRLQEGSMAVEMIHQPCYLAHPPGGAASYTSDLSCCLLLWLCPKPFTVKWKFG